MKLVLRSLVIIYFVMAMQVANAMEVVQLKSDTDLHPMGWISGSLSFKGGTTITINEFGEVISGVLTHYERLHPAADFANCIGTVDPADIDCVVFTRGTTVTFNEVGEVLEGTLGENASIRMMGKNGHFGLASNSYIKFNPITRGVEVGMLNGHTYFRPTGWKNIPNSTETAGYLLFKHGTVVKLNDKGEVQSGTIEKEIKLYTVDGKMKKFEKGTFINFNEKGQAY